MCATAKQGQRTLGTANVATHNSVGVRDQLVTGQRGIWERPSLSQMQSLAESVDTMFSWLDKYGYLFVTGSMNKKLDCDEHF